jgi:hypothetical protein
MKVRLAVIPPTDLSRVSDIVEQLRKAVDNGDMDALDASTTELIATTSTMRTHELDVEEWRKILAECRLREGFSGADYLVSGEMYLDFFSDSTAETTVLQIPYDEQEYDDV